MSSGWHCALVISHPDKILPIAKSSGRLRVQLSLCHLDNPWRFTVLSGWLAASAMSPLTLAYDIRRQKRGRPLCIHSATTAKHVPSSCPLWATCERPTSSVTFVQLFWTCSKLHGDHGVHGEIWASCVPPLNNQSDLSASFVPLAATCFCGRTREAQRSQPQCKGV